MTSETKQTTFGLLRHGETEWNKVKRIQGSSNSPLSPRGKELTQNWVETLKPYRWDRIIASDLGRVQETVEILNKSLKLPVLFDKNLQEQNWGDWEGLTIAYIKEHFPEELERRTQKGWGFSAPGGETRQQVVARVFETMASCAARWPGDRILLVCHQGVIKCLLYKLTGREFIVDDTLIHKNRLHLIDYDTTLFHPGELNIQCKHER